MSPPFMISQIDVTFADPPQNAEPWSPFVFAFTGNGEFEWGAYCAQASTKPSHAPNGYPIVKQGSPNSGISYLQVATQKAQYQIYWNDDGSGNGIVQSQDRTAEMQPVKALTGALPISTPVQFVLKIDLTANQGDELSLSPVS